MSLGGTIISIAQGFAVSDNVNLLIPSGYFVPPFVDAIFTYSDEDGQYFVPNWYVPLIPMILVTAGPVEAPVNTTPMTCLVELQMWES